MEPRIYKVQHDQTTPDEPHAGFYYTTESENGETVFHGPFSSRIAAETSIENLPLNV